MRTLSIRASQKSDTQLVAVRRHRSSTTRVGRFARRGALVMVIAACGGIGAGAALAADSVPTLTGRPVATPATASAPTYVYDPATGDVTVSINGNGSIVEVDLISAGNQFNTSNSKLASSGLQFITNTSHEQDGFTAFGSFLPDNFDLGHILPAGLTGQQLSSDLTAFYSATGVNGATAAVTVAPEPASAALLGLGGVTFLLARRRRRDADNVA
jgi:hypothetical protein